MVSVARWVEQRLWVSPAQSRGCVTTEHNVTAGGQGLSCLVQGQRATSRNTRVSPSLQPPGHPSAEVIHPPWLCTLVSSFGLLSKCWHDTSATLYAVISRIEEKLFAPSAPCPLVSFVTCQKQSVCYSDEVRAEDAEGCTGCPGIEAG